MTASLSLTRAASWEQWLSLNKTHLSFSYVLGLSCPSQRHGFSPNTCVSIYCFCGLSPAPPLPSSETLGWEKYLACEFRTFPLCFLPGGLSVRSAAGFKHLLYARVSEETWVGTSGRSPEAGLAGEAGGSRTKQGSVRPGLRACSLPLVSRHKRTTVWLTGGPDKASADRRPPLPCPQAIRPQC